MKKMYHQLLSRNWHIFQWNGIEISKDFHILTKRTGLLGN